MDGLPTETRLAAAEAAWRSREADTGPWPWPELAALSPKSPAVSHARLSDAESCGVVRRRLGLPLWIGRDPHGHEVLTASRGRTRLHNSLRDHLVTLLSWLGGLVVENLDRPLADMTGTPFQDVRRPDIRVHKFGFAPSYIDVRVTHGWSTGASAAADDFRRTAAGSPAGAAQHGFDRKLRDEYGKTVSSWHGCELGLGVVSTGGRAHDSFAGALRGWCHRAADRRGDDGATPANALGSAFRQRLFGALSVNRQKAVHALAATEACEGAFLSGGRRRRQRGRGR